MEKRFVQPKAGKILAAATAAVGLAAMGASQANAALIIDVRAIGATSGSAVAPKTVTVPGPGAVVTLGVFAILSGSDQVQQVDDWNFDGEDDRRNNDNLQTVVGSFQSVGGLLGNMNASAGAPSYGTRFPPFTGSGSSNGIAADWDSDGDLDLGSTGDEAAGKWTVRSNSPTHSTLFGNAQSRGYSSADGSTASVNPFFDVINATTSELRLGTIQFTVTGNNGATAINFIPRGSGDQNEALWFEDGIATGMTPGTASFSIGNPVNVVIPEPASVALLGLASLGLLARRRNA